MEKAFFEPAAENACQAKKRSGAYLHRMQWAIPKKGVFSMAELLEGQACSMQPTSPLPPNPVVAMAYVPFQKYGNLYPSEKALDAGTLFCELDKPFLGGARK